MISCYVQSFVIASVPTEGRGVIVGVIKENGWLKQDEIGEEHYFTYYFFIYDK